MLLGGFVAGSVTRRATLQRHRIDRDEASTEAAFHGGATVDGVVRRAFIPEGREQGTPPEELRRRVASLKSGTYIDDKTIETKVKSELLADPDVKGMAINVEVNHGRVQLAGFVDTLAQKNRASEIARNVEGVQYVQNNLAVK